MTKLNSAFMHKTQRGFAPIIVILLVIFAAAAAAGTVYVLKKNAESNLPSATPQPSSDAESEDEKACDKIPDQDQKDTCYSGIARAKKDPSPCDKIQDRVIKDDCYLYVIQVSFNLGFSSAVFQPGYKRTACYQGRDQ